MAAGKCLLEWEDPTSKPPVPLLKDMFKSERQKAKVLNFSIAYGKTAHGLAQDFRTSLDEAKQTVERWYADRPEVRFSCNGPRPFLACQSSPASLIVARPASLRNHHPGEV